jgi:hypothetical protein
LATVVAALGSKQTLINRRPTAIYEDTPWAI